MKTKILTLNESGTIASDKPVEMNVFTDEQLIKLFKNFNSALVFKVPEIEIETFLTAKGLLTNKEVKG